jgi:putative DNA primase/helicase
MGNAERLVNSCGDDLRYCHETKTWLIWNGRYWEIDLDGGIQRLAKGVVRNIYSEAAQAEDATLRKTIATHAAKSESRERVKAMVQMAATESGVPVSILQLDKNPMLLNVANGTVDLRTGVLRQHDKYDIMTGYLPFDYNPGATSPLWGQFLTDVFQDDALIDYIHRSVGYTLTGNVSEQVMFFAYGKGANGKSTFLNVLNYLLGRHSVRISSQILTQKPDNNTYAALAGLKGARCVIASEVEEGQRMAESLVKDMTGGDKITARLLYGAFFEFMPTHKLWQYGNHKPQIRGTDEGIWRRIHLIPFTQSFRGKANIPDMDKRLMREIEGVLAWAIRGCLKWQQSGLCVPQVITDATAKYRQDEDIIGHFIAECAEKNSMESTRTSDGYRIYREWALESGYKPLGKQRFNEQMEDHKFYREHTRVGEVWLNLKVRPYVSV